MVLLGTPHGSNFDDALHAEHLGKLYSHGLHHSVSIYSVTRRRNDLALRNLLHCMIVVDMAPEISRAKSPQRKSSLHLTPKMYVPAADDSRDLLENQSFHGQHGSTCPLAPKSVKSTIPLLLPSPFDFNTQCLPETPIAQVTVRYNGEERYHKSAQNKRKLAQPSSRPERTQQSIYKSKQ